VELKHVHPNSPYIAIVAIAAGRGEVCTGFWWGDLRDRDHWGDLDVDGRIMLRWISRE